MAHVLFSEREEGKDLAETPRRAHTVAAASEPSAPPADAEFGIRGEVVQSDDVKFGVATFDSHTGEATGNAIVRNCGRVNPSGDTRPSLEDVKVTKDIREAGRVLDIEVLDHVILGHGGEFTSLKEQGRGFE